MRLLASLPLALALLSCESVVPLEPGLADRGSSSKAAPSNCASCHAYPVGGVNHQFHLLHTDSLKAQNGPVSCRDCHASSLAERDVAIFDTLYLTQSGKPVSAYDSAGRAGFRAQVAAGKYVFQRIDTLVHHRPIPLNEVPGRIALLQEWVTGLDHLNGAVDVKFDPRINAPARFASKQAVFDPVQETCSAVACHQHDTPYRWPAPSKGLSGLNVSTSQK